MKKHRKKITITLLAIIILLVPLYGLFLLSKSRTFQFFGGLTHRVETTEKVVALTFDDAPTEYSNEVVDLLVEKNIPATFYVIGMNIEKHPEETKYIVSKGHELGNHSYSHQRFLLKSVSFIDEEIQRTNKLIKESGYTETITFRPPTGKKLFALPWYLSQHNISTIMWDVEPDTYVSGDKDAIVAYTLENTKPGSIILLHPFCKEQCRADREALPIIIDQLKSKGYQFVTASEILGYK